MKLRPLVAIFAVAIALLGPEAGRGQNVQYEKVTAEGVGAGYDDALTSALTHAIAQVNGIDVARQVLSQSVHATANETTATKAAVVAVSATERSTVPTAAVPPDAPREASQTNTAAADGTAQPPAADTAMATVAPKEGSVEVSRTVVAGAAAADTRQDFAADRTVVAMASSTAGVVNRYQVVSSEKQEDGWHVSVLAEISKYRAAEQDQRKKIAVLPLRLDKADGRFRQFETIFRTDLVNQLTQSAKLAVLDRDFGAEQGSELDFLKSEGVKKEEMARLGNKLGADYVIVGTVADASVRTETAYLPSIGRTVTGASTAAAKISYRVIETATGRIELADNWENAAKASGKVEDLAALGAGEVARSILDALFPMRVERVSNGVFYLGQGGKSVQIGQQYRVLRLGDDITDSYTHEIIGREEEDIGQIAIFEVEPKLAKARLIGAAPPALPADTASLVVRLVKSEATARPETAAAKPAQGKPAPTGAKALLDKKQSDW